MTYVLQPLLMCTVFTFHSYFNGKSALTTPTKFMQQNVFLSEQQTSENLGETRRSNKIFTQIKFPLLPLLEK